MLSTTLQIQFTKYFVTNQNLNFFRYVRALSRRGIGPKLIEGQIKTIPKYEEPERIESYKDFVKNVRKSKLGDELEIEKKFLDDDYYGDVMERMEEYYDKDKSEQKHLKTFIKKKIIGRKYFKLDRETNLLTYAAKEQIRFLHKLNPLEWNYKALSECFPISEAGVKKLLKCNFVLTCPEKIKTHDEIVARKWKILQSGKITDEISPITLKLYREGKLVDDYSSGNPNLPTIPPLSSKKVIELDRKKEIGEFEGIVQTYSNFENQKLLQSKENLEKQVSLRDTNDIQKSKINSINTKEFKKFKFPADHLDDDDDDSDPEVCSSRRKKYTKDQGDVAFSQFKEMLKEEAEAKLKSKHKTEYDEYVVQEFLKDENISSKELQDSHNCFLKIPKYEKETIKLTYEKNEKYSDVYKYDEKVGYQHPLGKSIKGKINISSKYYKKGKLHKVGQCIYDENGEFLYKVPT